MRAQLDQFYLFPDLIDRSVNPANFSDVQSYIDALVEPARKAERDRFFTFITSITAEEALASGAAAGFGIRLSYANNRVFVVEAFENAPGFAAGLDRGTEILAINGRSVASLFASGDRDAVIAALGPSDPGVTRSLLIRDVNGVEREVSVTKAEFILDPISDRTGVKILQDGGKNVGYLNLRTFFNDDVLPSDFRAAFRQFQQAGVTEVILDFRYNSGGFVTQAQLLGSLLGGNYTGQVFSRIVNRPSRANENVTLEFTREAEAIGVTKLAVIGTQGTASASELVANAFIPYLGNNVALIGMNTAGKPVGQIAVDRAACDDRFRVVAFRTVNAAGQGDYYTGLASVIPRTCRAEDQLSRQLGDPQEASIRTALDFLAGRSCTPISGVQGAQSQRGQQRELLRTYNDNPAQRELPGLF